MGFASRQSWFSFRLRSLFIVTAIVASHFAGRMVPARALREAELQRDVAQDRLRQFKERHDAVVQASGVILFPPRLAPVAVVAVDEKHITIAAGSDDGLKVGDLLDVRQNGLAVTSVRIVKISPDRSLVDYCRQVDKDRIVKGDFVHSR